VPSASLFCRIRTLANLRQRDRVEFSDGHPLVLNINLDPFGCASVSREIADILEHSSEKQNRVKPLAWRVVLVGGEDFDLAVYNS
jgi:hypothetical protein